MKNIIGQRFGRWKVIKQVINGKHPKFLCICDCGIKKSIDTNSLKKGLSKSCGCFRKEFQSQQMMTHSFTFKVNKTSYKFYTTYSHIKSRCNNPKAKDYPRYGGRRIKCLWKTFEEFRDDMHESYLEHCEEFGIKNTSIDRIDNNSHYSKENCRWATQKVQQRNRRNNRLITFGGKTQCTVEWAEETGINQYTLWARLNCYKWSVEKALTTPVS